MALNAIEMTVAEWINVPDHPRQRNTELRAERAVKDHLSELRKPHSNVEAVRFKGKLYKVNGHTRAFLWKDGRLRKPNSVTVTVNEAKDEKEFREFYDMADSKKAVKTTKDTLYGACRELGIEIKSSLLNRFGFATQLRRAAYGARAGMNKTPIYQTVLEWKKEIEELDALGLSHRNPFMIGEALKVIREHGTKGGEFFTLLDNDKGIKDGIRGRDGVQMAFDFIAKKRSANATAGWPNWNDIDTELRKSFKQWIDHRWNKTSKRMRDKEEEVTA